MSISIPSTSGASSSTAPDIAVPGPSSEGRGWAMPPTIEARSVLPDRYTDPAHLQALPGKDIDPSRMGIYICLLDDRPHLHPNLAALHKHRLVVHSVPSPADLGTLPVPQGGTREKEWLTWRFTDEEEQRRKSYLSLA